MRVDIVTITPHIIQFKCAASNKETRDYLCMGILILVSFPVAGGIILNRQDVLANRDLFNSNSFFLSICIFIAGIITLIPLLKIICYRIIELDFYEKRILEVKPLSRIRGSMAMSISFRDIQAFTFTITRKILYYDPTGCGAPIPELEGFMLNLYGSFNKDTSNREIWLELAEIPFEFNETHVIVVEYVVHQFMLVVPDKGSLEDLDRKLDQFKRTAYKGGIRASQKIVYPFELGPGDEMAGN